MRQLKILQQITQRTENSVNLYFQEVNKYPLISVNEEAELTIRIRKGDENALKKLVVSNLRFVISVAKQYQHQGLSIADLINEGNIGLVKAAGKFDETRGFKFISYAVWWIRQSIMQAIAQQTRTIRLPLNQLANINKINRAIPYLEQMFEREPTDIELAEYLDIDETLVVKTNYLKNKQISLDKSLFPDNEGNSTILDFIQINNISSPDNELIEESINIDLQRALRKLSYNEATIIRLSFGFNDKKKVYSLSEIAGLLNVSSERIRQLKHSALAKLRKHINGLSSYFNNL